VFLAYASGHEHALIDRELYLPKEWAEDPARRWAIAHIFETAKNKLGLDHNETRFWHGWHRHVSLVMLAFVMLAAIRRRPAVPLKRVTQL
jgi:SRSO17 transposase